MNFPNIQQEKVALLLCDRKTGNVLNRNGRDFFLSGGDDPYIIEDSLDNARNTANLLLLGNPNLEILVYDHTGGLIEMIKL